MTVKIASLKSLLRHSEDFANEKTAFISDIEKSLGEWLQFSDLDDYDCDVKLIFVETGGSEGLFLEAAKQLQEPYYLLTSGGNNSLAASLEIMTWIGLNGKRGEILHGTPDYIAGRIRELAQTAGAKRKLMGTRLGVVGKPSDWLISSVPDYGMVKEKLGVELVDISLKEFEKRAVAVPEPESPSNWNLRALEKYEMQKAEGIRAVMDEVIAEYDLKGLTIRCFDLLAPTGSTGCLGLSHLNDTGFTGTCEGDIAAMLSMHIVRALTGQSSFQANPSRIDTENNRVTFAHCTVPTDMLVDFRLDTHFESGTGVAIAGEMKKEKVTVFRLSGDLKNYYVTTGTVTDTPHEKNLCRTQIVVQMDSPVTELLKNPCGNHHIVFYGDHKQEIVTLMEELLG